MKNLNKNIILIGMPGSGKSTLGVVLAKNLGMRFLDSDLVIQEKYEKRLCELIDELGDGGFIELENNVNCGINAQNSVIATGGSAVYGNEAMEHFKKIGTVVYLKVPYEEIVKRLGDLTERGVVSNNKGSIREIFDERSSLYEKYADIVIEEWHLSIPQTINELKRRLDEFH